MTRKKNWDPIYPGIYIKYALEDVQLSKEEFADIIDQPLNTVEELLKGNIELDEKLASKVSKVLGLNKDNLLNLQRHFLISTGKLKVEDDAV